MITRNHRFHGRGSLRYVYQHGKTVRSPLIGLRFIERDHRQTFRTAIVVGKSISKSAVVRNRIRRRLYEIVRREEQAINRPFDLVITVYSLEVKDIAAPKLTSLVRQLFDQAHLTNGPSAEVDKTHAIIDTKET